MRDPEPTLDVAWNVRGGDQVASELGPGVQVDLVPRRDRAEQGLKCFSKRARVQDRRLPGHGARERALEVPGDGQQLDLRQPAEEAARSRVLFRPSNFPGRGGGATGSSST